MNSTSVSLLQRLKQSSAQEAWSVFVDLYTPLLVKWARRVSVDEHEAADLVQDIFAILVVKLREFEYERSQSFRAWLKTVLLNRWRNRQRHLAREQPLADDPVAGEDHHEFEEAEFRQYLVERACTIMRSEFEPVTWKACWEFVTRDRPASEVAAELGITVNGVYLAKSRVLRRLREEMAGMLD